ncbi:MAG: hypothetical protein JXR96_11725 [Deltaproteobacteria bacterium]|nr:hypothetical protein [Deltaproteobacteria bacterium]
MMRFEPVLEPPDFDARARRPGKQWLESHPDKKRPRDLWTPFKPALASGFGQLCGYSAIYEPIGVVDHYMSVSRHRHLAYEWSNYRFASDRINKIKKDADDVLDPFEVDDAWFEILLPSLQLVLTDAVPEDVRPRAEYTLHRLRLRDDESMIRLRREWYRMYQDEELTLDLKQARLSKPRLFSGLAARRTVVLG